MMPSIGVTPVFCSHLFMGTLVRQKAICTEGHKGHEDQGPGICRFVATARAGHRSPVWARAKRRKARTEVTVATEEIPLRPLRPSKELGLGRRAQFGTQESGVAGVQELENLGFRRRFSRADACPEFSDKDLARIFCNSCNSCNS